MNSATANPDCSLWTNSASWNDTVKEGLMNFALASMDALVYPFFWTWKVSSVLICYLGGALGATVHLSWFWSTFGLAFTFARAPVSVVFCLLHDWPRKIIPISISLPLYVSMTCYSSSP